MARRNPRKVREPPYTLAPVPIAPGWGKQPESVGDVVRSWCASGGLPYWLDLGFILAGQPAPAFAGFQLCAHVYVGQGNTGFVKSIQIAPYKPSILHSSSIVEFLNNENDSDLNYVRPDGDAGYWKTPMGWEAYFNTDETEAFVPPFWQWHIRFLQGTLAQARQVGNIPAFSFADPNSWFLVPNVPVPALAYPNGLPGSVPGDPWGAQRFQRIGAWEEGEVHIVVPSNTTVLLFAEWRQEDYIPRWLSIPPAPGPTPIIPLAVPGSVENDVFPLGPSFGKLIGYTQPHRSPATLAAARAGWQS